MSTAHITCNPGRGIDPDDCEFSFASRFGRKIPSYDDREGVWYIHRNSLGISGVVRARSWEAAYSICEDEFFPPADLSPDELMKEYSFRRVRSRVIDQTGGNNHRWDIVDIPVSPDDADFEYAWTENELFQEAYGFRPNGPSTEFDGDAGIYSKDLNGDFLDVLTPELLEQLEIVVTITFNGQIRD